MSIRCNCRLEVFTWQSPSSMLCNPSSWCSQAADVCCHHISCCGCIFIPAWPASQGKSCCGGCVSAPNQAGQLSIPPSNRTGMHVYGAWYGDLGVQVFISGKHTPRRPGHTRFPAYAVSFSLLDNAPHYILWQSAIANVVPMQMGMSFSKPSVFIQANAQFMKHATILAAA